MAQIFKTISLEERLKNSPYANLPTKPKLVQMPGESPPSTPKRTPLAKTSKVQITPFGIFDHTSTIQVQQFGVYQHTSPTQIVLPTSTLNQGGITLQQYNYQPNQGSIAIGPYSYTPSQGGLLPILVNFVPNQGGVQPALVDFIPNQGSTTLGPYSYIPSQGSILLPNWPFQPNHGSTTLAPYLFLPNQGEAILAPYAFIPNQGSTSLPLYFFVPNQGSLVLRPYDFKPNQGLQTPILAGPTPFQGITIVAPYNYTPNQGSLFLMNRPVDVEQGGVDLPPYSFFPIQGSTTPEPWTGAGGLGSITTQDGGVQQSTESSLAPQIQQGYWGIREVEFRTKPTSKHGSAVLELLRYSADRALALTVPRAKHGSATVEDTDYLLEISEAGKRESIDITPVEQRNLIYTNATNKERLEAYYNAWDSGFNRSSRFGGTTGARLNQLKEQIENPEPFPGYTELQNSIAVAADPSQLGGNLIASTPTSKSIDTVRLVNLSTKNPTHYPSAHGKTGSFDPFDDFTTLKISSKTQTKKTIQFRAYLTSFNDNITVNWNDVNYIGRQETLKTFKGMSRGFSLGFKVAATGPEDMRAIYEKLNALMQIAAVGSVTKETYLVGPVCNLTVGNWFTDTVVIFNSVKYDTQPTEYPWDIGHQPGPDLSGGAVVSGAPGLFNTTLDAAQRLAADSNRRPFHLPTIIDVSLDGIVLLGNVDNQNLNSDKRMIKAQNLNMDDSRGFVNNQQQASAAAAATPGAQPNQSQVDDYDVDKDSEISKKALRKSIREERRQRRRTSREQRRQDRRDRRRVMDGEGPPTELKTIVEPSGQYLTQIEVYSQTEGLIRRGQLVPDEFSEVNTNYNYLRSLNNIVPEDRNYRNLRLYEQDIFDRIHLTKQGGNIPDPYDDSGFPTLPDRSLSENAPPFPPLPDDYWW
jgi:hypothetical protein